MNQRILLLGIVIVLALFGLSAMVWAQEEKKPNPITPETVEEAQKIIGLNFDAAKRDSMLRNLAEQLERYEKLRTISLPNSVPPAILFNPIPAGFEFEKVKKPLKMSRSGKVIMPRNIEDLAFYSVAQLAELIRTRKVTSEHLTMIYLGRLKRYGPKLECYVTLTDDLALKLAKQADREIAKGKYRGPLHGIPFGVKDLLSVKGYRTTWGSVPYKDQLIDEDATVVKRLEDAGAVLVAKFTMGELAMGDVWFGGRTRNPWNYKQGSSGSSAGSASATAAGLVGFSIGTETLGSIVSPSTRCGITGLRPTYGRVSRIGAMALSWSMDKIGPICRTVEDCALVFNAIYGPDGKDQTLYDAPFNYDSKVNWRKLRIGYLKAEFDSVKFNKAISDSVEGTPTSISFIGQLFGEAKLLAVAKQFQDATDYHLKHPKLEE